MALRRKYLPLTLFLPGALALSLDTYASRTKTHQQPALITLQSPAGVLDTPHPISSISTSEDGLTLYTEDGLTGEVNAYASRPFGRLLHLGKALGIIRGPRGYSAGAIKGQEVAVWDSAGRLAADFKTYPADSLAFLSNGNLLAASPANGHLLHVYGPRGQLLRSFGAFQKFDRDEGENQFLHRGQALVDASDNTYFVYRYVPLIQKYAPDGTLLYKIKVTGAAIDVQQGVAKRFFNNRRAGGAAGVGGIHILTAAALDRQTGHLWVGMNGSSNTGVIYEYDERGEKLREYALESEFSPGGRITSVSDMALTDSGLHVLTPMHQVHSFSRVTGGEALRTNPSPLSEGFAFLDAAWTAKKLTRYLEGSIRSALRQ